MKISVALQLAAGEEIAGAIKDDVAAGASA